MLRQLLLSYGVGIGNKSLTPAERNVLHGLLTDRPEPLIAEDLAQNPATMHEHVKSIYRKFGISSRAMLMALWLGRKLQ
ncbi:helix-turn-helix transcriptional regulator [Acidihalobacter ferrooxydans]|uniref:helix-turn-helix transcriptional regulator n=1 Tax=Acidihalobacter ferrooxydans TaxID=1765967 RepID=UPI0009F899BC|nr:LuxR C-terminal-related transcriptional regulator [Acidihalobacter ferrooxydans]